MSRRPRLAERTLAETAQMMLDHNQMPGNKFHAAYPDWQAAWDFQHKRDRHKYEMLRNSGFVVIQTTQNIYKLALFQATDRRAPTVEEDANHTAFLNGL